MGISLHQGLTIDNSMYPTTTSPFVMLDIQRNSSYIANPISPEKLIIAAATYVKETYPDLIGELSFEQAKPNARGTGPCDHLIYIARRT